jgi:deoxyadenosine/deoxycytidine kinase
MPYSVITFGGMIGVGKSSYTKLVADHLGFTPMYESVEDNPLLDKFYDRPTRWAFALQIWFLSSRYKALKKAILTGNVIQDRSVREDALFATLNYEEGNMDKAELDCYLALLDNMLEEIEELSYKKAPELFIYLRGSFDTVLGRIKKRNRDYEQGEEHLEYFKRLHSRYDDWVFNHYKDSEVLVIDADKYDISRPEDAKAVLQIIDNKLKEIRS